MRNVNERKLYVRTYPAPSFYEERDGFIVETNLKNKKILELYAKREGAGFNSQTALPTIYVTSLHKLSAH